MYFNILKISNFKKILYLLIFFIFAETNISFSQFTAEYPLNKGWEIGANIGLTYFYGDINDDKGRIWNNTPFSSFYYEQKKISGEFSLSKIITPLFKARGHFSIGQLSGSNDLLNMYFDANTISVDGDISFQLLDFIFNRSENSKFRLYTFAGLGLVNFNVLLKEISTNNVLAEIGYSNNGSSKTQMTTEGFGKIGLGLSYKLNKYWLCNFETSLRYINTDKLDAFIDNSSEMEGYGFMSAGFVYKFDFTIKNKSSKWKNSSGTNNKPHNSGVNNRKKKKLR